MSLDDSVDLCIATTTPSEYEGAKEVLKKIVKVSSLEERRYKCDEDNELLVRYANWQDFPGRLGSPRRSLRVALVIANGQGREEALKLQEKISQSKLRPSVVAMTGVCAGNPSSVQLGDVLVPFEIAVKDGKTDGGGKFIGNAKRVFLSENLKTTARFIAGEMQWSDYIPEELESIPSPLDVQNLILQKVSSTSYLFLRVIA